MTGVNGGLLYTLNQWGFFLGTPGLRYQELVKCRCFAVEFVMVMVIMPFLFPGRSQAKNFFYLVESKHINDGVM